ncbi:MAG: ribose 5-phosphate isomerase B [Syntrophomonadaceae bacterium]|nr:ribose 5-phosphate isomerase B [Syntrophomonadaceae bacterium]
MKVIIGCDHAGVQFKHDVMETLRQRGHECIDCGVYDEKAADYPDIAEKIAKEVLAQGVFGIVICGTGVGISISANKIAGIRAALCHNEFTARMSRMHNDANVLALGARVLGPSLAGAIALAFLETEFEGGRHQQRVDKITALERKGR